MAQIFCAAVTLVTASEPRELTEVCRMIEPIAVIQSAFSLLKPHDLEFFVQVKQAEQSGDTL